MLSLGLSYLYPQDTASKCAIMFTTLVFFKSLLSIHDLLIEWISISAEKTNPLSQRTIYPLDFYLLHKASLILVTLKRKL